MGPSTDPSSHPLVAAATNGSYACPVSTAMAPDARLGSELLGYKLEEVAGRGGMGVVYRAFDLRLKRSVAVKLLVPELARDDGFRERFLAETEIAASLEHPNVIPIHDAGEVDGQLYLAMRYVEGGDLKQLLTDEQLSPERAIAICAQVADALDAAHARGLVHRDVKPSNVLLAEHDHAYLADFGLSRSVTAGGTLGTSVGTPAYVAPEQIRGDQVDGRADQYALGCLLHECLYGEPPFRADGDAGLLFAHLEGEPPAHGDPTDPVIARALAKNPDERYPDCRTLVDEARDALGLADPHRRRSRRLLIGALVLVALALALLAGALVTVLRSSESKSAVVGDATLLRVDPRNPKAPTRVTVGGETSGIAVSSKAVWVTSIADGTLKEIDPASGTVRRIVPVAASGLGPTGVVVAAPGVASDSSTPGAVARELVWSNLSKQGQLIPFDPAMENGLLAADQIPYPTGAFGGDSLLPWDVVADRAGIWLQGRALEILRIRGGQWTAVTFDAPGRASRRGRRQDLDGHLREPHPHLAARADRPSNRRDRRPSPAPRARCRHLRCRRERVGCGQRS